MLFGLALLLMMVLPSATWNALSRFVAPWSPIERYTFAQIERLPDRLVVPHGESFSVDADLKQDTRWSPNRGTLTLAKHTPIQSSLESNRYQFVLPSLSSDSSLQLRIGDYTHQMKIEPKLRPELTSLLAEVKERLTALGAELMPMTPAEFTKFVGVEIDESGKVIKAANIKVQ